MRSLNCCYSRRGTNLTASGAWSFLFRCMLSGWFKTNLRLLEKMFSGCTTLGSTGRQHHRNINQAIQANGELLRLSGLPARGWRHTRSSASTENLDRLHQGSMRAWDASASRKPTTLPPNMTPPKFFNKSSPREALRRVTSLLINRKGITLYITCFYYNLKNGW